MGINDIAKNVLKDEQIQAKIKKVVFDKAIEKGADAFFNQAENSFNEVKTATKGILKNQKDIKDKYNRLNKLVINPKTDFNDYVNGVEEADLMVGYYRYEVKKRMVINAKRPLMSSNVEKWLSLKSNLISNASKKMEKECKLVFESKTQSSFFSKYPEINNELLKCKTIEEANKLKTKFYFRYIYAHPTLSDFT